MSPSERDPSQVKDEVWEDLRATDRDVLQAIALREHRVNVGEVEDERVYGLAIVETTAEIRGVQEEDLKTAYVYRCLEKLVDLDLVETAPLDRRTKEYALTDHGIAVLQARIAEFETLSEL